MCESHWAASKYRKSKHKQHVLDLFFQVRDVLEEDEEDEEERDISDWLFELQEPEGEVESHWWQIHKWPDRVW